MRLRHAAAGLVRAVGRLVDVVVRRRLGVVVYSDDPACIFRISMGTAARAAVLSGRVVVEKGDPLVELHLWNERMEGRTAGLELVRDLRRSLEDLAVHLDRVDPKGRYRAVHGVVGVVGGRDVERLARIMRRLGFDTGPPLAAGRRVWRRGFWEALFSRWLLFAFNPRASRRQRLGDLARFEIWLSRATLRDRYGGDRGRHGAAVPPSGEVGTERFVDERSSVG